MTEKVFGDIKENIAYIKKSFGKSFDLIVDENEVNGIKVAFVMLDGMCNGLLSMQSVVKPITECNFYCTGSAEFFEKILKQLPVENDVKKEILLTDVIDGIIDGNMAVLIDGVNTALLFSVQGYVKNSVSDAVTEVQEFGSKESFTDAFKDNVTLIRRRIKSSDIVFENAVIGKTGKTKVCICYHSSRVKEKTVNEVRNRLKNADLDIVAGAGAVRPFLDIRGLSFFTAVGMTERPDVAAAKLSEGKVCVIVDGSPYVLIVPYLFIENFHSLDDYLNRPFYATFIRILKITCFVIAVLLPGIYVAVGTFHQELFPSDVLFQIAEAENKTPFPIAVEVFVIHFIYEIVREAGIRMPAVVGHAVNIVGALVIGDAAVTAGLIAAPTLIIVALTAISASVIPSMYQSVAVLRLILIIIGGTMGLYGVMIFFGAVICDICSLNAYSVPFLSPISPFDKKAQKDSIIFSGWKKNGAGSYDDDNG